MHTHINCANYTLAECKGTKLFGISIDSLSFLEYQNQYPKCFKAKRPTLNNV